MDFLILAISLNLLAAKEGVELQAKREQREAARQMRMDGVSVRDIAQALGVSKSSVSQWVRDIELTEAQVVKLKENQHRYGAQNKGARINLEKAREQRIAFQTAGCERAKAGSRLHLTGCMLYWAEGAKARNGVYFANSDPHMMLLFMRFLREEMAVANSDIKLLIHCHSHDRDEIARIERYWLDLLQLAPEALSKTQIKKGSDTRKNIIKNGICSIRVYKTELTHHIYGAIQEYGGFDNPDWLF